jgi:beta-N-acetylhexosaminidase
MKPVIVGCRTDHFTDEQLDVFKTHQPLGMIVFAEPFKVGPEAVHNVVKQFKSVCPHAKFLIDMEGGAVNRMKPQYGHGWRDIPSARDFEGLIKHDLTKAREAIYLNAQLIADDMMRFGINVNTAPVVDLISEEVIVTTGTDEKPHATSADMYKRSYSDDPMIVTQCGKAFADGLHSLGVTSVLKHAPGYGRTAVDPHFSSHHINLSREAMMASDLMPYIQMKDYPAIMTVHRVYEQIDAQNPATISPIIMKMLRHDVGFKGVIIADSIEMNSIYPQGFSTTQRDQFGIGLPLDGTLAYVTKRVLDAGCDVVLHSDCSRDFAHTVEILEAASEMTDTRAGWMLDTLTVKPSVTSFNREMALKQLDVLMK